MGDRKVIPYGRQSITEDDIKLVVEVLRSEWLTTGPKVEEFEAAIATYVGAKHAVAVSSGTAALHAVMFALGVGVGDEVIVPPMTFAATANSILYQGGTPVFVDVEESTLLLDPNKIVEKITPKTKAIIGVDYAGQPCDWDALRKIADRHNLHLVDDGCHALGAEYKGRKVGTLADLTVFSFHPVKHITTGEGGMIVTYDSDLAEKLRMFRNHGITTDPKQREAQGSWFYAMEFLGYNYRLTDFQCALGLSQIQKLPEFLQRRREIAVRYDEALADIPGISPLGLCEDVMTPKQSLYLRIVKEENSAAPAPCSTHAYHLYVVRLQPGIDRLKVFKKLRELGIGVNVHYIPVHLHPYYKKRLGARLGQCPVAEKVYEQVVSLPMYPGLESADQARVIGVLKEIFK